MKQSLIHQSIWSQHMLQCEKSFNPVWRENLKASTASERSGPTAQNLLVKNPWNADRVVWVSCRHLHHAFLFVIFLICDENSSWLETCANSSPTAENSLENSGLVFKKPAQPLAPFATLPGVDVGLARHLITPPSLPFIGSRLEALLLFMFQIWMLLLHVVILSFVTNRCVSLKPSFWTWVPFPCCCFPGLPRLQLSFLGISEQRCSRPLLWWFGQTLAGPRMEDGMDPYPRPERGVGPCGRPPLPVLVADDCGAPPLTHTVCLLRRSVRAWWNWASGFWVHAASSKVLWRASSTTRLKASTATPLASSR